MNAWKPDLRLKLRKAAETLRDLGGEEEYDLADACEDAARYLDSLELELRNRKSAV